MAKRKTVSDGKTQRHKFIEAARERSIDEGNDRAYRDALRKIATAPSQTAKTAVRQAKR